jgi:transposase
MGAASSTTGVSLHIAVMVPDDVFAVPRQEWDALCAEKARLGMENEQLRALVAMLRARSGKHSGNSSIPPSKDSIEAKAEQRAGRKRSQRARSQDRKPGGQAGHPGSGLEPTADPI